MRRVESSDIVILGGGLAGLSLARHLLLETDFSVLLLERRAEIPPRRQKVGESTVQLAGYYFSKVLDLEEHLVTEQLMKYNLRFYWPSECRSNRGFEDYAKSYIRDFSNIASYQLDRNRFEAHLLDLNRSRTGFTFQPGISRLEVSLAERPDHSHRICFRAGGEDREVTSRWVIDATGRGRVLSRRLELDRANDIAHGSFFWWVDGLVDVEKLTGLSRRERRLEPGRRELGHLPTWMATNHFMAEGAWFWVIPLRGKTSLGLVYDPRVVPHEEVFSVEKATRWICERFPLFAKDLPARRVLDRGGYQAFSHDCARTLSPERWAVTGESGRFSDPLYSPGSDLIAVHNTLIVDTIRRDGGGDEPSGALEGRCAAYERLMQVLFKAYEPSYTVSYDALGDQETMTLKYTWELAVYFAFYVFPFVNDLLTERRFLTGYLRAFSILGPLNKGLQVLLSGYFQWKKREGRVGCDHPESVDFTDIAPLARAREAFFEVGQSVAESRRVLKSQLQNLEELARFIAARVASDLVGDPAALRHREFVESLDPAAGALDPEKLRLRWAAVRETPGEYPWSFDPEVLTVSCQGLRQRSAAAVPPPARRDSASPPGEVA